MFFNTNTQSFVVSVFSVSSAHLCLQELKKNNFSNTPSNFELVEKIQSNDVVVCELLDSNLQRLVLTNTLSVHLHELIVALD